MLHVYTPLCPLKSTRSKILFSLLCCHTFRHFAWMFIHSLVETHFLKPLSIDEKTSKKATKITNTRERERETERKFVKLSDATSNDINIHANFSCCFQQNEFEFIIQVSVLFFFYYFCIILLFCARTRFVLGGKIILLF